MTRVLVAYASKHGATQEIAEAIAARLRARGMQVHCVEADDADPAQYDAVVLGSAVYMGRWRHTARAFLRHHLAALSSLPFWIFSSGPIGENAGKDAGENTKWLEPQAVLELADSAGVRGHAVFAGRVPPDPHGFVESSMVRNTPEEFRDARDWVAIRAWADRIATALERVEA